MTGRQPGHNPVCDHWYPTKTCGRRNPTVQSSWDNVTSPDPGGRVSRERTRRLLALRRSGARVDGMANSGELLINVVNLSKPKALTGLNQKGKWPGAGASSSPAVGVDLWTTGRGQVTPGNWTGPQGCGAGSYGPLHDGHGTPVGLGESRIGRKSRGQVDRVQQAPVVDHRRAGLLAIRAASGAPVLPVGEPPIREREPAGDDEPAGFGLGNRLRR